MLLVGLARYGLTGYAAWHGWGLRWAIFVAASVAVEETIGIFSRRRSRLERDGKPTAMGARGSAFALGSVLWGTAVMFIVYGAEYWIVAWIAGRPVHL